MTKILIVKTSALGDLLQAFPVLPFFKERDPSCTVDWVVEKENSALVRSHPMVDRVIEVCSKTWRRSPLSSATWRNVAGWVAELRTEQYDVVYDLQGNMKSGLLTLAARSPKKVGFGWKHVAERPSLLTTHHKVDPPQGASMREQYLWAVGREERGIPQHWLTVPLSMTPEEQREWAQVQPTLQCREEENVLVCPGSRWPNKCLSLEQWRQFLQCLLNERRVQFLFVWGNERERAFVEQLAAGFCDASTTLPRLALPVLQRVMQEVNLILTMDSLALHLAGTTLTPTFSFFGPSSAPLYLPQLASQRACQGMCPYNISFSKRCAHLRSCPTGACLHATPGADLFAHFLKR